MALKESLNAKAVAQEVQRTVSKGEKVNLTKIQQKHGYSRRSAVSMKGVKSKTYQKEMKPFVDRLIVMRDKILKAMDNKDLDREKFRDLSDALAKNTHDVQLLQGRHTSRIDLTFDPAEEAAVDKLLKGNAK